jgi:hypothetical protein
MISYQDKIKNHTLDEYNDLGDYDLKQYNEEEE